MTENSYLDKRIVRLERMLRWHQIALALVFVIPVLALVSTGVNAQGGRDEIRTKNLIIEDGEGRERIIFGAPIREAPGRISASTGFKILDPNGAERFGVGLLANDQMVMGFD